MTIQLSRLKQVQLRDAWKTEAGDFTPWLAGDDNISLLGDTIGIDLEVEAQEKQVGPFRADILCKDTATNSWVLIENQLERTDHTHLGQLMTYAAGLQAVTIVWIADRFTDEHRAALDWLNDITDEKFNFFGLEVELWRIAESPIAPKFNVVCKPNDWTRSISGATKKINTSDFTESQLLYLEYWTKFRELMESRDSKVRPTKPMPQYWMSFSIGRSNFNIETWATIRHGSVGVSLIISGTDAKPNFQLLSKEKNQLNKLFGDGLEWKPKPDRKQCDVTISSENCDPTDKNDWAKQHEWLYTNLEKMFSVFSEPIKKLDASEYDPDHDFE